jgi:uracil-DNA glycosylase family 4
MMDEEIQELLSDVRVFLEHQRLSGIGFFEFSSRPESSDSLETVSKEIRACTRCRLHENRTQAVPGEGNEKAGLMFIGEAPGGDEDKQGRPFVGKAGQLLTRIVQAIGLKREDVYITNVVKCRPPGNRNPTDNEIFTCHPYLLRQLDLIRPKIICTLGSFAAKTLLETDVPISRLRGRFHSYRDIKLMPTFHPAYLLRNPSEKRKVWEDMQMVQREYQTIT